MKCSRQRCTTERLPQAGGLSQPGRAEQGNTRVVVLLALSLVVGLAAGIWFGMRGQGSSVVGTDRPRPNLGNLTENVGIRFYACLDTNTVAPEFLEFAQRVERLLAEYETASNGKIKVTRLTSVDAAEAAAAKDGVQAFNLGKGEPCYWAVAVFCKEQKELLTQLSPEWEQALEWDLARAIRRVSEPPAPAAAPVAAKPAVSLEELQRTLPGLESMSVQEGRRALQEEALKQLKNSASQAEAELKEALQRLSQAQSSGSEAEQQARVKEVQQLQTAQAERYKQLAAQFQAQMAAFEKFKMTAPGVSSNK